MDGKLCAMRLDSSANIYPAIATTAYPQVYRLTVSMATAVVPGLLKAAVRDILPFFPEFCVSMARGTFWYTFEPADLFPQVEPEYESQPRPFELSGLQFRILYEKNKIHLEAFHALTDGSGAVDFLHSICCGCLWQG